MATISYCTWPEDGMMEAINTTKDVFLHLLVKDGLLTEEQALIYVRDYHVEVQEPAWISQWWKKMWRLKDDKAIVIIVKQMNLDPPEQHIDESVKTL